MITLATLSKATAQEVFDQVVQNLMQQGVKSITPGSRGACNYRTPLDNGTVLKCAAGWLIGDDEYDSKMDHGSDTSWRGLIEEGMVPEKHQELIADLQEIHDNFDSEKWEAAFQKLAYVNNLHYNSLPAKIETHDYVMCSTSYNMNETYIFPSNEEGDMVSSAEVGGIAERWGCDEWTSHKLAMSITFGDNHNYEFVRTLENTKCDQSLWKIKN